MILQSEIFTTLLIFKLVVLSLHVKSFSQWHVYLCRAMVMQSMRKRSVTHAVHCSVFHYRFFAFNEQGWSRRAWQRCFRLLGCWCGCSGSGCVWMVKLLTERWLLTRSLYGSGLLRCCCGGSRALQRSLSKLDLKKCWRVLFGFCRVRDGDVYCLFLKADEELKMCPETPRERVPVYLYTCIPVVCEQQ